MDPTKAMVSGEERAEISAILGPEADGDDDDDALMNRGMRLNEAKKRKRERQLEEQAGQQQVQDVNDEITKVKTEMAEVPINVKAPKAAENVLKKRKREATPPVSGKVEPSTFDSPDELGRSGPQPKKLKITIPAVSRSGPSSANLTNGPRNALAPPDGKEQAASTTSPRTRSRPVSTAPESAGTNRKGGTKITIKPSKAASAEPPSRRVGLRRGSNASLPGSGKLASPVPIVSPQTGRNGRRKRPAPGVVTAEEDGSAKIIVGKRKAAPKKKGKKEDGKDAQPTPASAAEPEEFVDPNEPRYCICGDVSWGTMIACDNEDVSVYKQLAAMGFGILLIEFSARKNGFISSVSSWKKCHQDVRNGIVLTAGRSSNSVKTQTALFDPRWVDELCH